MAALVPSVKEYRGTTVQVCGLWPFYDGASSPMIRAVPEVCSRAATASSRRARSVTVAVTTIPKFTSPAPFGFFLRCLQVGACINQGTCLGAGPGSHADH